MKSCLIVFMLSFSTISFASGEGPGNEGTSGLSEKCKNQVLLELKKKNITPSFSLPKELKANLAPFTGPVCKDKGALKINKIDEHTFEMIAIVKPHAGYDETGLRVECDQDDIKKQPIDRILIKTDNKNSCKAVLTQVDFKFDLND